MKHRPLPRRHEKWTPPEPEFETEVTVLAKRLDHIKGRMICSEIHLRELEKELNRAQSVMVLTALLLGIAIGYLYL